jgi:2'-5' RNA ligase
MARLFFALWPDREAAAALAALSRDVAGAAHGRAVPAANLHLTLVFLGEVPASRDGALLRAAQRVAGRPFRLALDQVGSFARSGVAWAGCNEPAPELLALQACLQAELEREGFAPEARRFAPHLTLARRIGAPVAAGPIRPVGWLVTELALVESARDRGGYATRARWPLEGKIGKDTGTAG